MKAKTFTKADDEFQKTAREIFDTLKDRFNLTVSPEHIMFLRTESEKKAFAYCKIISDEYKLLTDKKFFIVIISNKFDGLDSDAKRRHTILHELMHCHVSESGKSQLIKHNLEDFGQLIKDPSWNMDIMTKETLKK